MLIGYGGGIYSRTDLISKKLINQCPNCITVADFAHDHPKGIYILGPTEHAVVVMNGDWYDTWDSGNAIPTYYFRRYEHVSEWK